MTQKAYTFDRIVRILITAIVFFLLIWGVFILKDALIPFFVALLMAYLINPTVTFIQNKLGFKKRTWPVMITLVLSMILMIGVTWIVIPLIGGEVKHMGELLRKQAEEYQHREYENEMIKNVIGQVTNSEELRDMFDVQHTEQFVEKLLPTVGRFFSGSVSMLASVFTIITILLYFIFVLLDYEYMTTDWEDLIPAKYRKRLMGVWEDLEKGMKVYFRAQALVVLCVGILFAIGFSLIGLPMGIGLGLFIGLLNFVPYLQMAGFIPAALLALMQSLETGTNFWVLMGLVVVVFAVVQLIQEVVLTPKIMGDVTGLHPAIILLSLSIWGSLLGMLGMLLALPITTILISYYKRYIRMTEVEMHKNDSPETE